LDDGAVPLPSGYDLLVCGVWCYGILSWSLANFYKVFKILKFGEFCK